MHTYARKGLVYVDARAEGRGRFSLGVRAGDTLGIAAALAKHFGSGPSATPITTTPTLRVIFTKALATHYAVVKDRAGVQSRWDHGVAEFMGDKAVSEVTLQLIAEFRGWLITTKKNSPKTANRKIALVSKLLHLAEDWGYIARAPRIARPKETRGRTRWVTDAEEATLLAWLRSATITLTNTGTERVVPIKGREDMADLVAILIDTGMRLGEALTLRDRDVRLDADPAVYVWEQKGGGASPARCVSLSARAVEVLSRRLRRDKAADEQERGSSRPFGCLTHDQAGRLWSLAREAMGLAHDREFVIHALRHTFGVRMVEAGVEISTIQRLMGHSRVDVTTMYAKVSPRASRSAIQAVEERAKRVSEAPTARLAVAR